MTRRAQGIAVALAVILGIALVSGGVAVLAGSDSTVSRAVMVGTNGPNKLIGTNGPDSIEGRGGADLIRGRGGNDILKGGTGRDQIVGGKGFDRIQGGGGHDVIRARDRKPDTIECGAGRDKAVVDRSEDGVYDCEVLRIPKPSQAGRRE
jgi:Ca2+-binding RTX toxin-like protein